MNDTICKIENCDKPIRIKKWGMCQMHETRWRNHVDPTYQTNRKTIIPLCVPGGEIIVNYQKAKKVLAIVETLEKMILYGCIANEYKLETEALKLINSKYGRGFYNDYIKSILKRRKIWEVLEYAETVFRIVDKILENGRCDYNECPTSFVPYLKNYGIVLENNQYVFKESTKELSEKVLDLDIDLDKLEEYEICEKLQIHYKRYKKIT